MFLDLSTVTYTAYARDLNHNRPDNETAKRRTLLGAALVVLFAVVMRLTFTGDVIDKAVQLAQAQLARATRIMSQRFTRQAIGKPDAFQRS